MVGCGFTEPKSSFSEQTKIAFNTAKTHQNCFSPLGNLLSLISFRTFPKATKLFLVRSNYTTDHPLCLPSFLVWKEKSTFGLYSATCPITEVRICSYHVFCPVKFAHSVLCPVSVVNWLPTTHVCTAAQLPINSWNKSLLHCPPLDYLLLPRYLDLCHGSPTPAWTFMDQ